MIKHLLNLFHIAASNPIDEIITKALALVQPIFNLNINRQQLAQADAMIPHGMLDALNPLLGERDKQILGAPRYDKLDDVPICIMGNSKICKFVACTAKNFKNDESFENLNLAMQVLGDRDLRQAIVNDPGIMNTVCNEGNMTQSQCNLFTSGFRLIDKFMTSLEDMKAKKAAEVNPGTEIRHRDEPPLPPSPDSNRRRSPSLADVRRSAKARHRHASRPQSQRISPGTPVANIPQPTWWPAQSAQGRTIMTTGTNQEQSVNRGKRSDDYYDQVKELERRRGGQRGQRRRHPSAGSNNRNPGIGGRRGGSAATASGTDGHPDYYTNYETEDHPVSSGGPLDCVPILG